jgi:hypothetical protein
VHLEVQIQRARRGLDKPGWPWLAGIGHVDDGVAAIARLTDIRVIVVDHDLNALRTSALVRVPQQAQACVRVWRGNGHTRIVAGAKQSNNRDEWLAVSLHLAGTGAVANSSRIATVSFGAE